jgi:hypothetical protein
MKRNKKSFVVLMSSLMMAQSLMAQSPTQVAGSVNPITGMGGGMTCIGGPGTCNMDINKVTQDNTAIMLKVLDQAALAQKIDRDYLAGIAERMNAKLQELNSIRTKMQALSLKLDGMGQFADYISLVNQANEKSQALQLELQTTTLLTRESLPSYSVLQAGNMNASSSNTGNVNMGPLTAAVEKARAELMAQMDGLRFTNLVTPVGQKVPTPERALSPSLAGLKILSESQIQEYNDEIQEKMTLKEQTKTYQKQYVNELVNKINSFVTNYGTEEFLRFPDANDQSNDSVARASAFKGLTDAFYRRSYLRKKYGIRMGAIQSMNYDKRILKWDKYGLQPLKTAMGSFRREAAMGESEIDNAFESVRNFVQTYDEKITPVLGSKKTVLERKGKKMEFSSADTGFLVRANSAFTFLTGQRPTAEALLMIMRLVLSDIQEEKMLMQSEMEAMKTYHDSKYRATAEMKSEDNKKICQMDFSLSTETHNGACKPLGINIKAKQSIGGDGRSISEIFGKIMSQYETSERARRQEANMKKQLIDAANEAGQTAEERQERLETEQEVFN